MLRAALAVLALALSSAPAAAQSLFDDRPLPGVSYTFDLQQKDAMPASLTELYVKQAALQGLDAVTTLHALKQGHLEANPLLKSGNPTLIVGAKVAAMSLSVVLAQKLWKRNRKAAIISMVATNAALSAIVANNSVVLRSRR